jgi:nitrous oxidase accessory protein NosD
VDIEDSGGAGYSFQESPESRVIGGRIRNSRVGIFQDGSTNEGSYYGDGLLIEGIQGSGIVVASDGTRVEGVTIRNSGTSAALPDQGRAGIRVLSGAGSAIINTSLVDTQERPTQTYGVYIGSLASDTLIQGNTFSRNVIGPISNNGTGTVMNSNQGF